jgi:hypothetical protein
MSDELTEISRAHKSFYGVCSFCNQEKLDCFGHQKGRICGSCRWIRTPKCLDALKKSALPDTKVYGAHPFPLTTEELRSVFHMLKRHRIENESMVRQQVCNKIKKYLNGEKQ